MSALQVGSKVVCRGALASDFSLEGKVEHVVENMTPDGVTVTDIYKYGVRLVNGNYKLFPPEDVKAISLVGVLYDADPNCAHDIKTLWDGVKCSKCPGWFCY